MRLLALLLFTLPAQAADSIREVEAPYLISGDSGIVLYRAIGESGPRIGAAAAIAATSFRLTWRRDYRRDGQACVLKAAEAKLVITTALPKPAKKLPAPLSEKWAVFIAGIRAHEQVHAQSIRRLLADIRAATIGYRQENDPSCTAIRKAIETPLKAASDANRARNAAFDKVEMGDGGTVQQLVLALVNP